jgi:two-component system response regulator DesR
MRRDVMSGMDVLPGSPLPVVGSIGLTTESPPGLATESSPGLATENPVDLHSDWRGRPHLERPRPAITIALIGGQRLLRDATASLLTAQDGLQVLGAYASAAEFLAVGQQTSPTVLLFDCDGAEPDECHATVRTLSARPARSRVVLLCRAAREEIVRCAIEHRAGGVLLKSYSTEDILAALAYTTTGRTVLPAGWQQALPTQPGGGAQLSPRHRQILALIAAGRRNEEIALDLELSPNTIKFHIRALYSRLGVRNRVEAANLHAQITSGDG